MNLAPEIAHGCTSCGEIVRGALYAKLGPREWMCAECWHNAKTQLSKPGQEQRTRERMLARGRSGS